MKKELKIKIEDEHRELVIKLDKLTYFIGTNTFDNIEISEKKILLVQQAIMTRYGNILRDRLALIKEKI